MFPKYYIIRVKAFKNVVKTALDEWMSFLKDNSIKDNTTVPGLVEAKKKLLYDQMSEKEKRSYLNHIESVFGEEDATTYARAEGKVEGKLEGIAEGLEKGRNEERAKVYQEKLEMAKKMKAMNMTIEQISIVTGLSIDEIKKI
ncbi:MAG: hypothetical protein MJ211_02255 [Bacteroidales bacterium]|nr:hypothetical protein [Bacteroidales bacterium]